MVISLMLDEGKVSITFIHPFIYIFFQFKRRRTKHLHKSAISFDIWELTADDCSPNRRLIYVINKYFNEHVARHAEE